MRKESFLEMFNEIIETFENFSVDEHNTRLIRLNRDPSKVDEEFEKLE